MTDLPLAALCVPVLILGLVLASSGFDLIPELGVFNAKRLLQPLVFGASLIICLLNRPLRIAFAEQCARVPGLVSICCAVVFLLGVTSVLRFANPEYGLAEIALLGLVLILVPVLAACRSVAGTAFDRLALFMIASLGLVVAFTELTGLVAGWALGTEFGFEEMLVRFAHPRFYNQLQSWTLPVLAAIPLLFGSVRKRLVLAATLVGIQWAIVLMAGGRGTFIALLLGLIIVAALARPAFKSWPRTHLLGALIGILIFSGVLGGHALLAPSGGNFVETSVGRSMTHSTGRTYLWELAAKDAMANPWLGAGPMRFDCEGPGTRPAHPHSFPMQLLSEWGIPAFLITAGLFAWLAWRVAKFLFSGRTRPGAERGLSSLLAAGILAAALHACLSGVLMMPASQMMAVVMCGWLLGLTSGNLPSHREALDKPGLTRLTSVIMVAGLVACIALTKFNVSELRQYEARIAELVKAGPVQPRYWQHGRACLYAGY
ncbi:MAG: O-antigen ligase family protein [Xanthomonadales bacterium]|nr:O-antigen ligase family protein [Xanthomonadales bacterium]